MKIQQITNNNNYNVQTKNNAVDFKGELGKRVLQNFLDKEVTDSAGVEKLLKALKIGSFGLVAFSKVTDILLELFGRISSDKNVIANFNTQESNLKQREKQLNTKQTELDRQQKAFDNLVQEKNAALDKKVGELSQQLTQRANQLTKRENDLNSQMKSFFNTQQLVQQAEIDRIFGDARVLYNHRDPNIKIYASLGEQCRELALIFENANDVRIYNFNSKTLNNLAKCLQDNDGFITNETLEFIQKVVSMRDFDVKDLYITIRLLKDDYGNIDRTKFAHFLALYSIKNSSLSSTNAVLAEEYIAPKEEYSPADTERLLDLLGVSYKNESNGIVITEYYNGDPDASNSIPKKLKDYGADEYKMMKNIIGITRFANFENSSLPDLDNLEFLLDGIKIENSSIASAKRLKTLKGSIIDGRVKTPLYEALNDIKNNSNK